MIVHTQAELDAALAAGEPSIHIDSPAGVWLTLRDSGSSRVEARGSSRVVARGSSSVVAWESSRVVARGSSSVVARESSSVVAWESSSVVAWESSSVEAWESSRVEARGSSSVVAWESSRVEARGSSSVVARGSSRVEARGSSSVVARESSRVEARGSSRVEAWESSRVEARESSSVEAWESSSVVASPAVAVHLHSAHATVTGGVVIDITALDLTDPQTWCDHYGARVEGGTVTLYKALDDQLQAGHAYGPPVTYTVGATVTAADFEATNACGGGLHLGPTTSCATAYRPSAARWVRCEVPLAELLPILDGTPKVKVRECRVVAECDRFGDDLAVQL